MKWTTVWLVFLCLEGYPQNGNVYHSMGDFNEATGDKEKAMDHFRNALAVHEKADTPQKLQQLEKK